MSLASNRLLACFLFVGCCGVFTSSCVSHKELAVTQILRTDDCLTCTSAMFIDSNTIQLSFINNTDDTIIMHESILFGYSFRESQIGGIIKLINTSLNKEVIFDAGDWGSIFVNDFIRVLPSERISYPVPVYWYFPKPLFKKRYHYAIVIVSPNFCSDIVVEVK